MKCWENVPMSAHLVQWHFYKTWHRLRQPLFKFMAERFHRCLHPESVHFDHESMNKSRIHRSSVVEWHDSYKTCHRTLQLRQIRLNRNLVKNRQCRALNIPSPTPSRFMCLQLVRHKNHVETFKFSDFYENVVFWLSMIVSSRQPKFETDSSLHAAAVTSTFELKPSFEASWWDFLLC